MKIVVLILMIIVIIFSFKLLSKVKNTNHKKNVKSNTIDLEIDPVTKEYKPKD